MKRLIWLLLAGTLPMAAQQPRTHFVYPSPLYIPATGPFAGKGAFRIIINEVPSLAQNCNTQATITPDPSGQVKVDPMNVSFSGSQFFFDVTVTSGQLTKFTLPVNWITSCPQAHDPAGRGAHVSFSVSIASSITVFAGNGANGGNATNGDSSGSTADAGDPVSTATGELHGFDGEADLSLGGPLPLEFRRYYASFLASLGRPGLLGLNWMHNFEARLARFDNEAIVTLFRGNTVRFMQAGSAWNLAPGERLAYQLVNAGGDFKFLDPESNLIYTFNGNGGLIRVEDRNGNAHTITQTVSGVSQVADGLGRLLKFTYGVPNLVKVEDQTGRSVNFTYVAAQGTAGILGSAADTLGKTTTYTYTAAGGFQALLAHERLPAGNRPFSQEYDTQGRVSRQTDSRGNATRFEYTTTSANVIDPLGGQTRHVYDLPGAITKAIDAAGKESSYAYDSSNRRTEILDRRGGRTVTAYHPASGYPASVTDAAGNVTTFTYATQSQAGFTFYNLGSIAYPDGTTELFEYDATGNLTKFTDRAGKIRTRTFNSRGQVLTEQNPLGGTATFTYNNDGTLATRTDAAGNQSTFEYDTLKRLAKETYADGSARQFTYDARDRVLTRTDERGKQTAFLHNDNGKLQRVTDPKNATTQYAYDGDERLATTTDALSQAFVRNYDENGRLKSIADAANTTENYGYDAVGRVTSVSDGAGKRLDFGYDAEGGLTSMTDGLGRTWRFERDLLGRATRNTNPLNQASRATYDALGRLTEATNPAGEAARITYDPRGLPSGVGIPESIAAVFTRNDLGEILSITDPNGFVWSRTYDSAGRQLTARDPLGRVTSIAYDNRGRVRQVTLPEGSLTLTYDAAGNITRRLYSDGTTIDYTYDDNNRLTGSAGLTLGYDANARINASNGITIGRDNAGRTRTVTYAPGKTVTYEYNSQGLLVRVQDWIGGVTEFTYNAAREVISTRRPNGVVSQLTYDGAGRLAKATWAGESVNASFEWQRDAAGRVTREIRNLPQAVDFTAQTKQFTYDAAHQRSDATYDRMGRIVADGGRTYTWDLASRLRGFNEAGGNQVFGYDGLGQLVSAGRNYVWNYAFDPPVIAIERDGQADVRYFIYSPTGQLLESIDASGQRRFYHVDQIGTVLFLTGNNGAVTNSYGITPYGEVLSSSGGDNPFTFVGGQGVVQLGSSGLYYMRARFYDANSARFLSKDPLLSLDPRALNPYQYAFANPLANTDPTGLSVRTGEPTRAGPFAYPDSDEDFLALLTVAFTGGFDLFQVLPAFRDIQDAEDAFNAAKRSIDYLFSPLPQRGPPPDSILKFLLDDRGRGTQVITVV